MSLRHVAATVLTTAITSTAFLAVSAPGADAAPQVDRAAKACVTKAEYKKAKKGMAQAKVHKIFGTSGKHYDTYDLPNGNKVEGRSYKVCTSKKGAVGVSYVIKPGKKPVLASKAAVWK